MESMQPAETSPRQTLSYLRTLFEQRGIRPKNKLGQNFLIDLNVLDVMVAAAELSPEDLVVEVGSGTGSLTARLAEQAGAVLSVEVDLAFHALTAEIVADRPNVALMHEDILRNKNELNPDVLAMLDGLLDRTGAKRVKLVANLPYVVATPVICKFLLSDVPLERSKRPAPPLRKSSCLNTLTCTNGSSSAVSAPRHDGHMRAYSGERWRW